MESDNEPWLVIDIDPAPSSQTQETRVVPLWQQCVRKALRIAHLRRLWAALGGFLKLYSGVRRIR